MKIKKLILDRYGVFTDREIDFYPEQGSAGHLHLLYGPNEAGKSTTLNALADLRFGFPHSTSMDFIHNSQELAVSAVMERPDGTEVGVRRLKKRKGDLKIFDPNAPDALEQDADVELVALLEAGLSRQDFQQMYGIDHSRLQEGGRQLVNGEGDLGSALFEASAGTVGLKSILASLAGEAGKYFTPRASTREINKSAKRLSELAKELKQRQVKPAVWAEKDKSFRDAKRHRERLLEDMENRRRELAQAQKLRAALPTLGKIDGFRRSLDELAHLPDLSSDVRDRRLSAQQGVKRATFDISTLEEAIRISDGELAGFDIDHQVLEAQESVEALDRQRDRYSEALEQWRASRSAVEQKQQELAINAGRISSTDVDELIRRMPGEADTVEIQGRLDAVEEAERDLNLAEVELSRLDDEEREETDSFAEPVSEEVKAALEQALRQARGLGDVTERVDSLDRAIRTDESAVEQKLGDLGRDSVDDARTVQPLMEAEIQEAERQLGELETSESRLKDRIETIKQEIMDAAAEVARLQAEGETVTPAMLIEARQTRDDGWDLVFRRYIESVEPKVLVNAIHQYAGDSPLPVAFQNAIARADHYGDKLHEDVQRSTQLAQRQSEHGQKSEYLGRLNEEIVDVQEQRNALLKRWSESLGKRGLPETLQPSALFQWQRLRVVALELDGSKCSKESELELLKRRRDNAVLQLAESLTALGEKLQLKTLEAATLQADAWLKAETQSEGMRAEKERNARKRFKRRQDLTRHIKSLSTRREVQLGALKQWTVRLSLNENVGLATLRARLNEFRDINATQEDIWSLERQCHGFKATVNEFCTKCDALSDQLQEAAWEDRAPWVEHLAGRLKKTLEQCREKRQIETRQADAKERLDTEKRRQQDQSSELETLLCEAGVSTIGELEGVEEGVQRRRYLKQQLQDAEELLLQSNPGQQEEALRSLAANDDEAALDTKITELDGHIESLKSSMEAADERLMTATRELEAIDASDQAASIQEEISALRAKLMDAFGSWSRLQVAGALLNQALASYREKAQGPIVKAASEFFSMMTDGRYQELVPDEQGEHMVLLAKTPDGRLMNVSQMSEGTADQLYLALRLAALKIRDGASGFMPLVLDDVAMTSDDRRTACLLKALDRFGDSGQILLYTHHRHLLDIARDTLGSERFQIHEL
jgi:uncharacterized protein YhaN